jgi:hypothetical protein
VALAVSYFTTATNITSSAAEYTVPSTGYYRDLAINNGSTALLYVTLGTAATSAAAATGFLVPAGQTTVLMGQAPPGAKLYAFSPGTATLNLGWASVVSVI